MSLDKEQEEKVINWLNAKVPLMKCSECGATGTFALSDIVNLTHYRADGSFVLGGPTTPMVPVFCANCGHAKFFSAMLMGLIRQKPPPSATESKSGGDAK